MAMLKGVFFIYVFFLFGLQSCCPFIPHCGKRPYCDKVWDIGIEDNLAQMKMSFSGIIGLDPDYTVYLDIRLELDPQEHNWYVMPENVKIYFEDTPMERLTSAEQLSARQLTGDETRFNYAFRYFPVHLEEDAKPKEKFKGAKLSVVLDEFLYHENNPVAIDTSYVYDKISFKDHVK
jgi:hypothetical protein